MNSVAGTEEARGARVGYVIVLIGSALFVASCFIPYYGFEGPAQRTFSLYEQQTTGAFDGAAIGRLLYLFAGVAIAGSIAVVGVARSDPRPRVPTMLTAAVAAWSLPWIGVLLSTAQTRLGISLELGYWVQAVGIGVVIIGTIVVMASARANAIAHDET